MASPTPKPYRIDVSDDDLAWITERVKTARIPPDLHLPPGKEWEYGIPNSVLKPLVDYWRDSYDWRKTEERLNSTFNHFTIPLEENGETIELHFVHHRSEREDAIPLLFSHGWPGSFLEVEHILKGLTAPEDPKSPAFHVVAPSMPGFGFSSRPTLPGWSVPKIANIFHKLMQALGYSKYIAQGGDWGSMVSRALGIYHPDSAVGVHINFIVALPPSAWSKPLALLKLATKWLTSEEKELLARFMWFRKSESGYSAIQGTKPQTISVPLCDSPVGTLAWIREKVQMITREDFVWEPELILTWIMMYVLPNSSQTAAIYKEAGTLKEELLEKVIPSKVAFGYSLFPRDAVFIPRWWAQGTVAERITLWNEHKEGGHFPSVECPDVLVADIQQFAKTIGDVEWKS